MISTRIDTQNRTKLETVIPLKTPYILYIDPSAVCNFSCKYCYQSNKETYKQIKGSNSIMSIEDYKKIIDELTLFPDKIKVLRLYSFGEPLINKNFCDMVKYAKRSRFVERVDTTTNGLLLKPDFNIDLIYSGIDRINISVNGLSDEQFFNFTGTKVNFERYVANIKDLYENRAECYLFIKINGDSLSKDDEQKFKDIFEPIADSIAIERTMGCWNDFEVEANKEKGIYNQELKEVLVCPYVFYAAAIQADGSISTCSLDWNKRLILGNAKHDLLYDIWNGWQLTNFRKLMLQGARKDHPVCRNCGQLTHGSPDSIDEFRRELLKRFI